MSINLTTLKSSLESAKIRALEAEVRIWRSLYEELLAGCANNQTSAVLNVMVAAAPEETVTNASSTPIEETSVAAVAEETATNTPSSSIEVEGESSEEDSIALEALNQERRIKKYTMELGKSRILCLCCDNLFPVHCFVETIARKERKTGTIVEPRNCDRHLHQNDEMNDYNNPIYSQKRIIQRLRKQGKSTVEAERLLTRLEKRKAAYYVTRLEQEIEERIEKGLSTKRQENTLKKYQQALL
jgi:hypothetical protein